MFLIQKTYDMVHSFNACSLSPVALKPDDFQCGFRVYGKTINPINPLPGGLTGGAEARGLSMRV